MQNDEVVDQAALEEGKTAAESATAGEANETELTPEQQAAAAEETRKKGVQKRFDELTRKAREAERDAAFYRDMALKGGKPAEQQQEQRQETAKPAEKPKADDFETTEEYVEAMAEFVADERDRKKAEDARVATQKSEQQKAQEEFGKRWLGAKARIADFDDVVNDEVIISPAVQAEMIAHEHGPDLAYYLGKNPSEAERLNKLSPLQLAREVTRLEPKFIPAAGEQQQVDKTTKAPPPITPTGRTSAATAKEPGEMSPSEYRKHREAELMAKRKK